MNLSELSEDVLPKIFAYLPFEAVGKNRRVDRSFNAVGCSVLNIGFNKALALHGRIADRLKSLLPRRESEQKSHPFYRHNSILVALGSYLELLRVHFEDSMKEETCCFYPGKLLDEIWMTLRHINLCMKIRNQPRERMELLNEIRDLSKMAVDHFKEKIEPKIEEAKKLAAMAAHRPVYLISTSSVDMDLEAEVAKLKIRLAKQEKEISRLKKMNQKIIKRFWTQQHKKLPGKRK